MDNINCLIQGDPAQQHRLTEMVLHTLKEIYPTIAGELKYYVSIKKAAIGGGDWALVKEILGWITNTVNTTLSLSSKQRAYLQQLLPPPNEDVP